MRYPTLIRKYEPKPIRVFLQDGSNDNNKYGGDWWMANQTMERELSFAGYEVQHAWGDGGHTGKHATATAMGIQVCDQAGKVQCVLVTPNGRVSNLCFGGKDFDTLFVTSGDRVYKRKLKVKGAQAWDTPHKPAPPKL